MIILTSFFVVVVSVTLLLAAAFELSMMTLGEGKEKVLRHFSCCPIILLYLSHRDYDYGWETEK